jgi:hypothetical protein
VRTTSVLLSSCILRTQFRHAPHQHIVTIFSYMAGDHGHHQCATFDAAALAAALAATTLATALAAAIAAAAIAAAVAAAAIAAAAAPPRASALFAPANSP